MALSLPDDRAEARILALFADAGPVPTPTPGVKAWLARDGESGQSPLLIKCVDGTTGGKGRATEALALLHPAVVRTRRWLADGGRLYVVRDVVRGKNLRQLLTQGGAQRSAEAVRRLLAPVLEALLYTHEQGLVHGGISPENVLVADDGKVYVSDFATADPKAPQHFVHYNGTASVRGDVSALSRVISDFLPTTGAFANAAVRERIGSIVGRCDTLSDLKETVDALERLATAPMPRSPGQSPGAPQTGPSPTLPLDLGLEDAPGTPRLSGALAEKSARVMQGGGGAATLILRNEGTAALIVRMIATQHAWLNVRPIQLPLTIAPGGYQSVTFAISAARLTPGEYRSEVYLSANASGKTTEDLPGGWFKHTAEIRITVVGSPTLPIGGNPSPGPASAEHTPPAHDGRVAASGKPPYPSNAPRLSPGPGCLLALPALMRNVLRHEP